jgi:hypothetical protein
MPNLGFSTHPKSTFIGQRNLGPVNVLSFFYLISFFKIAPHKNVLAKYERGR